METAIQGVFIGWHLLTLGVGFSLIGKTPPGQNRYAATGKTAALYAIWTTAFLIWWAPSDPVALIGLLGVLTLMWGPWVYDLPEIHKPYPTQTLTGATLGAFICAARIGLVLGFWVLY